MLPINARIELALARLEANLNLNVDLSRQNITNIANTRNIVTETRSITYRLEQTDLGGIQRLILQVKSNVEEVLLRQNLLHEEDLDQFRTILRRLQSLLRFLESNLKELDDKLVELKRITEGGLAGLDRSILGHIQASEREIVSTFTQRFDTFLTEFEDATRIIIEQIQTEDEKTRDLMNQIKADLLQRVETCETQIKIAVEEAKSSSSADCQ